MAAPVRRRSKEGPPPQRPTSSPPSAPAVGAVPKGDPIAQAPVPHVGRPPVERGVGSVPNPRRPMLVRDVGGGDLKDLFALFPDLPRPPRPAPRLPKRVSARRGRRP